MKEIFKHIIVAILTWEATLLLKRTKPKIIAITGNIGKTSTKDAIFAVLKDHVHARKSEKSYNSDLSIPLTILGLQNAWNNPFKWLKNLVDGLLTALHPGVYPKILVLEMGVDQPGDMKKLTAWIKPDVVVITRLPDVPVHVEYFAAPEDVAHEKLILLEALKPDGIFVFNNDDQKVKEATETIPQQSIGFSRYSLSHFTASADQVMYDGGIPVGLEFVLTHLEKAASMRVTGSLGVQHAYNYAAAAAVGSIFEIPVEEAMRALHNYVPPPGRMRLLRGIKDILIIDDTYNSSPTATERALQTIKELKGVNRKVAVLGDMLELGQFSV
ncbi:Mur ligase family protein, partial [Candidatus Pacebacteria bacterium]|nr:Mur ligase family protein [Candidatus Paceibacterota bacterium]